MIGLSGKRGRDRVSWPALEHRTNDERDIGRSAKSLVEHYGADAALEAALRADVLLKAGDTDWQRGGPR